MTARVVVGPGHQLYGVRVKIERAGNHLKELDGLITDFLGRKYYETSEQVDIKNGLYIFRMKPLLTPPSTEWGVILGEVVHNLMSALDNLAWQLALLTKPPPARPYRYTSFPIYDKDTPGNAKKIAEIIQDIPLEAQDVIKALQPYHLGAEARRHALSIVHHLWNTDKHKIVPSMPLGMQFSWPKHPAVSARFLDDASIEATMPLELRNQIDFKPEVVSDVTFMPDEVETPIGGTERSIQLRAIRHAQEMIRDNVFPSFLRFFPPK